MLPGLDHIADFLDAVTGLAWTVEELHRLGEKIINIEKAMNARAGLTRRDDYPPERMFEAIPSGPAKGLNLDFTKFEQTLDQYYDLHRWDKETGLQTRECLKELGLEDIAKKLG